MIAVVISIAVLAFLAMFVMSIRHRALALLSEVDRSLGTYRKIRHILGQNMLMSYPSLITSDLRMKLLRQLDVYWAIEDDESERRWERLWMPKLMNVADDLQASDVAGQDKEFMDIIDGFKTNELLIADAKDKREQLLSNPVVTVLNNSEELRDSHASGD